MRVGIFTGFLFDVALSAAYASSDILVFPSTTDTFGSVVLEAMASGVPVIVRTEEARASSCSMAGPGSWRRGRNAQVRLGECLREFLGQSKRSRDRRPVRRSRRRSTGGCRRAVASTYRARRRKPRRNEAAAPNVSRVAGSGTV